jgi:type IV pilus assembly protein PilY1
MKFKLPAAPIAAPTALPVATPTVPSIVLVKIVIKTIVAIVLVTSCARAAVTNIAQVPLLNIEGIGSVKPNLMLLFDNSGSMDQAYTPDYVNDNLCRSRALLSGGTTACTVGHPPFMSTDFNKQYYNPTIRYSTPIKADGSYYNEMTATNTSNWSIVSGDGFGAHKTNMFGTVITNTNLVTGFPDLKWCDPANLASCRFNTATYAYPDNVFRSAVASVGNAYYYTIGVAEYCTDDAMQTCKSTSVGAPAPTGYPVPAKLRWCNSTALTTCQAKRVGTYLYPRYSTSLGAASSYGTIAIGASVAATSLAITSVTIADPAIARTITNGSVAASSGTDTPVKQQATASALAASIIAKTGLSNQYWACVDTPLSAPTVAACSTFGIALGADNIVAVIPVACSGSKSLVNCTAVDDGSRAGWGINVTATSAVINPAVVYVAPTAVLSIAGTSSSGNPTPTLASISYKGAVLANNISIGKSSSAATAASRVVTAIGTAGLVRAYVGGNLITPVCALQTSSRVCLVESNGTADGGAVTNGSLSNAGTMVLSSTAASGYVAAVASLTDAIAVATTALAAPSTFVRTDIVGTRDAYPVTPERTDCITSAGRCTYAEEMTNFANWYAYYKTRLQLMKVAVGVAFAPLTSNYRVGYAKLSVAGSGGAIDIKPLDFSATARTAWYSALYNTTTSGSTPIRPAMDNVGKMFANLSPYNYASGLEVVQFPCQQNFMILTTDGYWNGASAGVLNNDNVENAARFCTRAAGCVDTRAQSQPSISDVALYWYNGGSNSGTVSLRPALEPDMSKPGLVPAGPGENTHLHMTTFTLGLGVDGVMTYDPDYDSAKIKVGGDFYKLINGVATGCPWNGNGPYVWPDPNTSSTANTVQERVDDLWHAAINGHGKYFSTSDPKQVVAGLSEAITKLQVKVGAAAAAATSTPNISQEDRDIFSATFTTVKWYGELTDRFIDAVTGEVDPQIRWSTSEQLGKQTDASTDSRTIKMFNTAGSTLKNFSHVDMTALELSWFANKCSLLAQCALLTADNKLIANSAEHIVNWLRGQQQYANDTIFRSYTTPLVDPLTSVVPVPILLGDIASAKPAYLFDARKSYPIAGYAEFKSASLTRQRTLFAAANDGMLHAFYAPNLADGSVVPGKEGGKEIWAYAPRITMKKLALQASTTYGSNHQFSVDGSPELGDVQIGGAWRTVLVAGLNAGGRGYYALDVTDPQAPTQLWELCADSSVCSTNDPDLGLSFGNPQFGYWNGKWVVFVTSGYNNVPAIDGVATGNGRAYLYIVDVASGAVLKKVSTGSGDVVTPSGLSKITAITDNPASDPVTTYVYGGDNLGQMWRFDLTDLSGVSVPVVKMGDAGLMQPITARPDVSTCKVIAADGTASVRRVVLFGSGRLLDVPDVTNTDVQSLYLLRDGGSTIANVRGSTMVAQALARVGTSGDYTISDNGVDLSLKEGWYLDWNLNSGERMNLDPKIVSGAVNVVTNIPSSASACSVGGTSNVYQFDLCSGSYLTPDHLAGRILSNTSAAVGFIIIRLPSGSYKMVTTTADGKMIMQQLLMPNTIGAHKVGWRRVKN